MLLAPNIFLDEIEKEKLEKYIKENRKSIEAILLLINIHPFNNLLIKNELYNDYLKYISKLSKKHQLQIIGFFDDNNANHFELEYTQKLKKFKKQLAEFINLGIKYLIRSPKMSNLPLGLIFENINIGTINESLTNIIPRLYSKELFWENLQEEINLLTIEEPKKNKSKSKYKKRISIAHPDSTNFAKIFYEAVKNSNDELRDEIDDIYFGKEFVYDDGIKYFRYSNVMNVNASNAQVEYLFKIQKEFGINISLTMNSTNYDSEILLNKKVLEAFINWLRKFYDKGLRVCTISNIHLIKSGILQKEFPLMKWKNTVNHKIMDTQGFINYANLGYDYIQLDRSLVRNMEELKKISSANKNLDKPKKLYLLSTEFCAYECPFKTEHDVLNEEVQNSAGYFQGETKLSHISCDNWRFGKNVSMPRLGVDLLFYDNSILDDYLQYVDVLKISGRFNNFDILEENKEKIILSMYDEKNISLDKALKNSKLNGKLIVKLFDKEKSKLKKQKLSKKEKKLYDFLKTCNNQCYSCHLCEETYGVNKFNSLLEL